MAFMEAFLVLHLFVAIAVATNETSQSVERSQRGIALLGYAYRSVHSGNYPSCLMACMDDSICMSFNFWWNTSKCDLNNKTKHTAELKFLAQDVPATYMGLMRAREPDKNHQTSSPTPLSLPSSCKHVNPSSGDGYYSIDPKSCGNPLTVYCDMTTDGGGWTLIYRTIVQTSDAELTFTTVDNYTGIFNYRNNPLVPVDVLNQLRQDMGFSQMRFYCHKKLVGRTLHIMTKDSPEGEMMIRYFTNSTQRPASCGSFVVLPEDNSSSSHLCSNWGSNNRGNKDKKWGTSRNKEKLRLHVAPIFSRSEGKTYTLHTKPTRPGGLQTHLMYCDDHWGEPINLSTGDTWVIFVR